jgi:uncharacterized protein (TIGR00369 family)
LLYNGRSFICAHTNATEYLHQHGHGTPSHQPGLCRHRSRQLRQARPHDGAGGGRIVAIEPGFCAIELSYAPGVSQQQGFFHGGAIVAIADTAAGHAAYSLMPAGSEILTVEYKLNLVRAALPPMLRAEGHVLRAGKTLTGVSGGRLSSAQRRQGNLWAAAVHPDAGGAGGRIEGGIAPFAAAKREGSRNTISSDQNDKRGECRRSDGW